MSGYHNHHDEGLCLVDFSNEDQEWLEDIGALEDGVDACGDGTMRKRFDIGSLRKTLEASYPVARTQDDYVAEINAQTGTVEISGASLLTAAQAMTPAEQASLAALIQPNLTIVSGN